MKVGILSWSIDRSRTGVDNYLYSLLNEMHKLGYSKNIDLIHHKKNNDPIYNEFNEILIPKIPLLTNTIGMPLAVKNSGVDILHFPFHWINQTTPFFINYGVKKILTIHDLTPILFPEMFKFHIGRSWAFLLNIIKKQVDFIIVDSYNTREDCIKYLGIPENKIGVTHLAADSRYCPLKDNFKEDLKRDYNINYNFILHVGTVEARKNITSILKSLYKIKKRGLNYKLVNIGAMGWKHENVLEEIQKLNLQDDVIFPGYVPDDDLIKFYNAADLLVYPSFYEGFGLPPLEAMACGTPVITSNTSSLPEVVGEAGIMVDPLDVDALTESIYQVLTNPNLQKDMQKNGLERSKMFTWEKTAKKTWKIYEMINEI